MKRWKYYHQYRIKFEIEKQNKQLENIPTKNITEENNLIGAKLVRNKLRVFH